MRFFSVLLNAKSDKLDPGIAKDLPQRPTTHAVGIEPTEEEVAAAIRSISNGKAVGPDELPLELLKLGLQRVRPCSGSFIGW